MNIFRFLVRKLNHAYELYPLFALTGLWFIMFCYVIYYSFEKMEVWLDRSESRVTLPATTFTFPWNTAEFVEFICSLELLEICS